MRDYLQIRFKSPKNISRLDIAGVHIGPVHGIVSRYKAYASLDGVRVHLTSPSIPCIPVFRQQRAAMKLISKVLTRDGKFGDGGGCGGVTGELGSD